MGCNIHIINLIVPNEREPGFPNSKRMIILKVGPISSPTQAPAGKYKVPISLWLQDSNHYFLKYITILQTSLNS